MVNLVDCGEPEIGSGSWPQLHLGTVYFCTTVTDTEIKILAEATGLAKLLMPVV